MYAPMRASLARRVVAEAIGTAFLLAIVVGSGIMGESLANGNAAVALLANSLATGAGLLALILTFGPVSAHFNPVVTIADASLGGIPWRDVPPYLGAQVGGAFAGVGLAHVMFGKALVSVSHADRSGLGRGVAEVVATFGLIATIHACSRRRETMTPFAVAAYITAAYWFTSSTSFANPAVTLARAATSTFAGIRVSDVPLFVAAEVIGAAMATVVFGWLVPKTEESR
ncbi:MIP/aquaporin family protein [soil metagenome]